MKTLSIGTVPLHGTRLIEASAGTGKTFTLTGLYLRLLLEGSFDVSQLLVVTFTEAATDELRGRVRERLREAVLAFEAGSSDDPVLSALLAACDDHAQSAQQLRDAITRLDEAAIFTIHGFCQRMLGEHAFESGALFDSELTADATTLQQAVIEDFWRTHFYDAEPALAAWIGEQWATPADLLRGLAPWLQNAAPRVLPPADDGRVETVEKALFAAWTQAKRQWKADEIRQLLLDAAGLGRAKDTYRKDKVEDAVAVADDYFADARRRPFVPEAMALLTSRRLAEGMKPKAVKDGIEPPSHAFFDACGTLVARARDLEALRRARILTEAADYLREGLARRKRETRQLTFNDLLVDLDAALQGEGGDALARTISERFPVALVDEFQDTDPLQYRIFERIYGGTQTGAWYMIGDPKQAIYGFRGADIFTYIRARRTTDEQTQHFTLDTNWRSASALVDAVNGLFSRATAPFVFDDDIPFRPVASSDRADREPLRLEGEIPPALAVWPIAAEPGNVMAKGQAQAFVASACAAEIVRLLTLGRRGRASIGDHPLRPGDIAVLVPTRNEADAVRLAFDRVGIKSVYISRDSVFATDEAPALEHLLAAVAEPGADRRLRAALSTHLLGADAAMLDAGDEDPRWLQVMEQFQGHHDEWLQRGFMPFFQRLLHRHQIPARLLAMPDGERRLTNLLQLGELAQAASTSVWGMTGLLRWLADQRRDEGDAEEKQLRLESDAGLVKIVTIHKSKGLEYPVVFLPFLWSTRDPARRGKGAQAAVTFHDPEDQVYSLDLGSDAYVDHRQQARIEQLAEDLRLLYVALTRAKHRCYVAWGRINSAAASALAYLLYQPPLGEEADLKNMSEGTAMAPWQELAERMPRSVAVTEPPSGGGRAPAEDADAARLSARILGQPVPRGWRIASYSSLSAGYASVSAGVETPDHDAVDDVTVQEETTAVAETPEPFASIAQFPRGARAGTCLHALLERLDFTTAAGLDGTQLGPLSRRLLARHGFDARWEPAVSAMVGEVLEADLGAGGRLSRVAPSQRLVELEFFFPLDRLVPVAINRFLADYRGVAALERPLHFSPLAGLMKGFVDLVFERDGRYFIADYKSNYLGATPADYDPGRLPVVMRQHDYDLQYLIYSVALCRYLARRVPGFSHDTHFGGVYYLFLRGMRADDPRRPGVHFHRPDEQAVRALDLLLTGGESA